MTEPKVRYVRKIGGHPVEGLAQLAINEQYSRGFRSMENDIAATGYDQEAVWIDVDGECVAMIQFARRDWGRFIQTGWSYTLPKFRRRGFNATLFQALESIAKRDGYHSIRRNTNPRNTEMLQAFEKAGGKPRNIEFIFEVTDSLNSINDRYEFP